MELDRRSFLGGMGASGAAATLGLGGQAHAGGALLGGDWRVRLDHRDSGKADKWYQREPSDAVSKAISVQVGACLQEFFDYPGGVAWYFKDFHIPDSVKGQALQLRFAAVYYFAEVWLNGALIGSHEGGYTPFSLDITKAAKIDADNLLCVRVVDPPRPVRRDRISYPGWPSHSSGAAGGFRFMEIAMGPPESAEGFKIGGIWQPVEFRATNPVHVSDVFLWAALNGSVEARVEVANQTAGLTVAVAIASRKEPQKILATAEKAAAGAGPVDVRLQIPSPHLWSLEDPYLYVATVTVREGARTLHSTSERFGIREFTIRDGHFFLNGKRLFIKGGHYQGTYPLRLFNPPSREFAFREIGIVKELGFNFMRLWARPAPPDFLDAADELGILIQEEPAVLRMEDNPEMLARSVRETRELVLRDRNRPSVVIWNMINELAPAMKVVRQMCQEARRLDPSRLITESNGGQSHYYLPGSAEPMPYLTEHSYPGAPITDAVYDYWRKRANPGGIFVSTEFGFGGMEDVDAVLAKYGPNPKRFMEDYRGFVQLQREQAGGFRSSIFRKIFPTLKDYREASQAQQADALRAHVEAMRANPAICGFNLVQVFDSNALELDGLVDFWRNNWKKSAHTLQELNRPVVLIVRTTPMNVRAAEEAALEITLANEQKLSGRKKLTLRVKSPSGREVLSKEMMVETDPWVSVVFNQKIRPNGESGRYAVEATLWDGDSPAARREDFFTVFRADEMKWPPFHLFDPEQHLAPQLKARGVGYEPYEERQQAPAVIAATRFTALWRRPEEFRKFLRLFSWVERGCTALFLGAPQNGETPVFTSNHTMLSPIEISNIFPFALQSTPERWGQRTGPYSWGLEDPIAGIPIPDHPVFEGLPHTGIMSREYANVAPNDRLVTDRRPIETLGPALQIFAHGKGRIVITTFDFSSLAKDALAERLLANLMRYCVSQLPETLGPVNPDTARTVQFRELQYQDCLDKVLRPPL